MGNFSVVNYDDASRSPGLPTWRTRNPLRLPNRAEERKEGRYAGVLWLCVGVARIMG